MKEGPAKALQYAYYAAHLLRYLHLLEFLHRPEDRLSGTPVSVAMYLPVAAGTHPIAQKLERLLHFDVHIAGQDIGAIPDQTARLARSDAGRN